MKRNNDVSHPYKKFGKAGISQSRYQRYTYEMWGAIIGWALFVSVYMPMNGIALAIGEGLVWYLITYRRNPIRLKRIAEEQARVRRLIQEDEQRRLGTTFGAAVRSMQQPRHYDYDQIRSEQ